MYNVSIFCINKVNKVFFILNDILKSSFNIIYWLKIIFNMCLFLKLILDLKNMIFIMCMFVVEGVGGEGVLYVFFKNKICENKWKG